MGTIIAYSGDNYNYLGYATSGEFDGLFVGIKESPLISSDGRLLIGVLNNKPLQQHLLVTGHKFADVTYKSILQSFDYVNGYPKFCESEMLMITCDNDIFYWRNGVMFDIKGKYFAIGEGRDIAMGCMYGIRSSEYTDQNRVELTLKAISYNRPNQAMSTGFEKV